MVAIAKRRPLADAASPRAKRRTIKRRTTSFLDALMPADPQLFADRPRTRGQCRSREGSCPWVSCKYHLYLDVNPDTGSIKLNFPDLEPWELDETCALDVADQGGITLEEVGDVMHLTRERVRQVEARGLLKLKMAAPPAEDFGLVEPSSRARQRRARAAEDSNA